MALTDEEKKKALEQLKKAQARIISKQAAASAAGKKRVDSAQKNATPTDKNGNKPAVTTPNPVASAKVLSSDNNHENEPQKNVVPNQKGNNPFWDSFAKKENGFREELPQATSPDINQLIPPVQRAKIAMGENIAKRAGVEQENIDKIREEAAQKFDKDVFSESVDSGVANLIANTVGGLEMLSKISPAGRIANRVLGDQYNPFVLLNEPLQEWKRKEAEEAMMAADATGKGDSARMASQMVTTVTEAIPDVVLAFATAGTSAVASGATKGLKALTSAKTFLPALKQAAVSTVKNPSFWLNFEQMLYPEYESAIANGATEDQATATALLSAFGQAQLESSFGFQKLPSAGANTIRQALLDYVKSAIAEGNEEVVQSIMSGITQKLVFDHDKQLVSENSGEDAVFNMADAFGEWFLGTFAGGILGIPGGVTNVSGVIGQKQNINPVAPTAPQNDVSIETENITPGSSEPQEGEFASPAEPQATKSEAEQLIDKVAQLQEQLGKPENTVPTQGSNISDLIAKLDEVANKWGVDTKTEQAAIPEQPAVEQPGNEANTPKMEQLVPKREPVSTEHLIPKAEPKADARNKPNGAQRQNIDVMLQNMDALGENISSVEGSYEGGNDENTQETTPVEKPVSTALDERVIERYRNRLDALKTYKENGYNGLNDAQKKTWNYMVEHDMVDVLNKDGVDKAISKYELELYGNEKPVLNPTGNDGIINSEKQTGGNNNAERMEEKGENPRGNQGVQGTSGELHTGREGVRPDDVGKRNSDGRHQVLYRVLNENDYADAVKRQKADVLKLYDYSDDYETFSKALEEGKTSNPKGYMVDGKTVDDLAESNATVFMTEDGSAGALVTKDGDVEGVFKNTKTSTAKRAVYPLLLTAVANGGVKLDCYGPDLVNFYNGSGFEAVGRVEYVYGFNPPMDEAIKQDITNGIREREPDVYAMKLRDGVDANAVAKRMGLPEADGGFHRQTQEELDALPLYKGDDSYDEMLAARDKLLEKGKDTKKADVDDSNTGSFNAPKTEDDHPNTVGAMQSNPDSYSHAQNTYGTYPEGEKATRVVDVPTSMDGKTKVTRFERTEQEAGATPDELIKHFEKATEQGDFNYDVVRDKDSVERASKKIINDGYKESVGRFIEKTEGSKRLSKDDLVYGEILYAQAAQTGDTQTAMKLASALAQEFTKAGQAVQAARVLKKLSPEGKLYAAKRIVDRLNGRKHKAKEQQEITISDEDATALITAKTEKEIEEAEERIKQHIADQVSPTLMDKWNAWRYLSMLGNPKTHIRNFFGNAAFVPARAIKNGVKATIEHGVKSRNKNYQRTTTIAKPTEAQRKAADESYERNKKLLFLGGSYRYENEIESKETIFKNKVLETLRKKNSEWLEKEDTLFLKRAYKDSFAKFLKANNIDPENITKAQLLKAEDYAQREAWKATYRDVSKVATALEKFSRSSGTAKFFTDALIPFRKTPINILRRGIEYSPAEFAFVLLNDAHKVKSGDMEAEEMIDHISSGLTGTGFAILGAALAHFGLISGGDDEDEKVQSFGELQGGQNYALTIGDMSYTIDWLTPTSLPLFVGVEAYNAATAKDFSKFDASEIFSATIDAISKTADPMIGLSMLKNLETILSGNYGGEGSGFGNLIKEAVMSYALQAFPTLGSQIAQTIDPHRRNAYYTDKTNKIPDIIEIPLNRILAKIPGASKLLPEKVDNWGRPIMQEENIALRVFENFASPGYISHKNTTKVDEMLSQLYNDTGDGSVLPGKISKYFNVDGERLDLSAKQYSEAQKETGQVAHSMLEQLVADEDFQKLSAEEKAQVVGDIYEYARVKGKQAVSDYEPTTKWYGKMEEAKKAGVSYSDFIVNRNFYNSLEEKDGKTKNEQMVKQLIADRGTSAKEDVAILEYAAGIDMDKYKAVTNDSKTILELYSSVANGGTKSENIDELTDSFDGNELKAFALYSASTGTKKYEDGSFKNFGKKQLPKAEKLLAKGWKGEDVAKAARAVTGLDDYLGKGRKTKKNYIKVLMEIGFTEKKANEFYNTYGW